MSWYLVHERNDFGAVTVGREDAQADEIIDERGIVFVCEVDDGVDHQVDVLLLDGSHQSEVEEGDSAFRAVCHFQEVARVRVTVEEADLQQLYEKALLADLDQFLFKKKINMQTDINTRRLLVVNP